LSEVWYNVLESLNFVIAFVVSVVIFV